LISHIIKNRVELKCHGLEGKRGNAWSAVAIATFSIHILTHHSAKSANLRKMKDFDGG
jgi:hypothetical protein